VSFDTVTTLAERVNVENVLLGSFVKAGSTIRISVKLQEAKSGEILAAERVEASGEADLFPRVDDLTRRLKTRFETTKTAAVWADRDLKDVTTASPEAYRYYVEGINLHEEGKEKEAIPLLEKAVALDPDFAMALAKLSVVYGNVGLFKQADECGKRALAHVERLTARERYYVEGVHYSRKRETWSRSLQAYRKAVELFPDHASARNNIAVVAMDLERFDEAIEQYEELKRQGMTFPWTHSGLALAYHCRGDVDKGEQAIRQFGEENPRNAFAQDALGSHLALVGKLDEALAAHDRAEALAPGEPDLQMGRAELFVLRDEWDRAQAAARAAAESSSPFPRAVGSAILSELWLYKGRSRDALGIVEQRARALLGTGLLGSRAHNRWASILLLRGQPALALDIARKARLQGHGDDAEVRALFLEALAQARLGRHADAAKSAAALQGLLDLVPGIPSTRMAHHLAGELALVEGRASAAVEQLKQATALLSPRGGIDPPPPHIPIWFALASAHLAAGEDAAAAEWFGRVAGSNAERVRHPIPYVRSFYFLGKLHEKRGEMDKAREHYRRFVSFWRDGDLDRERVAEAERKLR